MYNIAFYVIYIHLCLCQFRNRSLVLFTSEDDLGRFFVAQLLHGVLGCLDVQMGFAKYVEGNVLSSEGSLFLGICHGVTIEQVA